MILCTNIYAINIAEKLTTILVHQHYMYHLWTVCLQSHNSHDGHILCDWTIN